MTADAEVLGHEVADRERTNEERVLAVVADRPDGCSSFAVAIETRIPRSSVEPVLKKLERQGKVQGVMTRKGVLLWYPRGQVSETAEPKPSGEGICRYCGKHCARPAYHERLCRENPDRFVPVLSAKAKRPGPAPPADPAPPASGPTCATCSDPECGDQGKHQEACEDHEAGPRREAALIEQAEKDLAAMPACESGSCTIQPDPVLDAPFAPEPRAFRESVPVAVMDPEPKPWNWPTEARPEAKRPEVQEDVRAWLLRTLSQLSDDARARGFEVEIEASWGNRTIHAHADLKAGKGARE